MCVEMDSGKVLALTPCGWVYPALQRFHIQCRGQAAANTCTIGAQIKRKHHRYLFMLSVKLSLKFLPTTTRVLPDTYFSLPLQGILGIMGRIYVERHRKKGNSLQF